MPRIDNELMTEISMEELKRPELGMGDYLTQRLRENIETHGDGPCIHDTSTDKSLTYCELSSGAGKVASALRKRGLQIGDAVLLMASNFIEFPVTMVGVWKAGGACACLTLNLFAEDIRTRASDLRAKFIVTDEARAARVLEAVTDLDFVQEVFVIGKAAGCTSIDKLFEDDGKDCPERLDVDMDSLAWLMYSSGTTGTPKGIVHTHRDMTMLLEYRRTHPILNHKMLFLNHMINSGGMALCLLLTLAHCDIAVISSCEDYNLLEAIEKVKPYSISVFPNHIATICRHRNLDQYDLTSVRMVLTGGSLLYPKYEREIYDKLPNMKFLSMGYGMSESFIIAMTPMPDLDNYTKEDSIKEHVIGSVGRVGDFVKVKISDLDSGEKLGPNEIGEICVHSPFTMKEYMNNPKATAETIQDGWLHTGDKGYYDDDENVFVIGRFKELIKYRMAHVVPTNIEKRMMTHPAVEEVGVVGQPDEVDGELPTAFVVLRKGHSATAEELVDFTNGLVIDEEKLRGGVRFIDRIPRNELGKIVRPKLKKRL